MKKTRLAAIATTGLFCLMILPGAIMDIVQPDFVVDITQNLGLPLHVLTLVGIWKLLGIVGLVQTKSARVREWATAGFFFDLTGAAWCHGSVGDTAGIAPPLVILVVLGASTALRQAAGKPTRNIAGAAPAL